MKAKDYLKFIIPLFVIVLIFVIIAVSFAWYSASSSVQATGTLTAASTSSITIGFVNTDGTPSEGSAGTPALLSADGATSVYDGAGANYLFSRTYFVEDQGRENYCGETAVDGSGELIALYKDGVTTNYDFKYTLYYVLGITSPQPSHLDFALATSSVYKRAPQGNATGYYTGTGTNSGGAAVTQHTFYNPTASLTDTALTEFSFKLYALDTTKVGGSTSAAVSTWITGLNATGNGDPATEYQGGFCNDVGAGLYLASDRTATGLVATEAATAGRAVLTGGTDPNWFVFAITYCGSNSTRDADKQVFAYSATEWLGSFFKFGFTAGVGT